ncbi:aldo/keto reductase family oxidoreductase [Microbulbifer sp. GL-2]|uniref:aldo/keto reductase n=1 Tax=Microbulbifer sp. GL-2 TaxID=2591606 RepID=UPI0011632523|nr:aldo/keto reductase family oxidoreductase [Microbulbifer sp. GL-2]BBM03403.1 oxidoreductase [Microbulbifer sp. GL-2]
MVQSVAASQDPYFSELVQGYWRLVDWQMTPQQRLSFLKQHVDLGITTIDHADIYGDYECEQLFGEGLKLQPGMREQIQIVTKCNIKLCSGKFPHRKVNHYDTSAAHLLESVENSLARLGTDYIDVLLLHRPDALMDADEIAETFAKLHTSGKVLHFGVSNFSTSQFDLLQSRLDVPLVTNQVEINPLNISAAHDGTLDQLQMHRLRPMAWSCLAGGRLLSASDTQAQRIRNELILIQEEISAESLDQVIYAWVRRLPASPLVIIGSGKLDRLKAAVDSLKLELTREQWYRIWVASKGHDVP